MQRPYQQEDSVRMLKRSGVRGGHSLQRPPFPLPVIELVRNTRPEQSCRISDARICHRLSRRQWLSATSGESTGDGVASSPCTRPVVQTQVRGARYFVRVSVARI